MQPKAIETRYKGYRFRSRLEARWAIYFDTLGISWDYEPEGFELDDGTWYLPDFVLKFPSMGKMSEIYVEVKPGPGTKEDDWRKAKLLSRYKYVLLLAGTPSADRRDTLCGPNDIAKAEEGWYYFSDKAVEHRSCGLHLIKNSFTLCTYDTWDSCSVCIGKHKHDVERAVTAARQARFEHGQTPS